MDSVQGHYALVMLKQYYDLTTCIMKDDRFSKHYDDFLNIILNRKSQFVHVFSECIATFVSLHSNPKLLKDEITYILQKENAGVMIQFYYNFNNKLVTDEKVINIYNSLTNYFQSIKADLLYQIASFIDFEKVDIFRCETGSFTSELICLLNFLETIFTFTLTNDVTKQFGLPVVFTCNSL